MSEAALLNSVKLTTGDVLARCDQLYSFEVHRGHAFLNPLPKGAPVSVTALQIATWLAIGELTKIGRLGRHLALHVEPRYCRDRRGQWVRRDPYAPQRINPVRPRPSCRRAGWLTFPSDMLSRRSSASKPGRLSPFEGDIGHFF